MTKMTATVHVEFELLEGQANNTANTAHRRRRHSKIGDRTWCDWHRSNRREPGYSSGNIIGQKIA